MKKLTSHLTNIFAVIFVLFSTYCYFWEKHDIEYEVAFFSLFATTVILLFLSYYYENKERKE